HLNTVTIDTTTTNIRPQWLQDYRFCLRLEEVGYVVSVGDGISWVSGLPSAAMGDVLLFEDGSRGVIFDMNEVMVGAILLHTTEKLTAGVVVHRARQTILVPVGNGLLGRVIDPLGIPLDGQGLLQDVNDYNPLETGSPPITAREFVQRPLHTGIKVIDTLIPIGKGQRQLLIGDEGLGRSALAIDTVLNQRGKNVYCVYVLIGQKRSTVVKTIDLLKEFNALDYTVIVVAEASALPGLQFLAPYAGCAIAEHWMARGHDTLVIYDDLSTHAKTYRELSLLLRRPPGREAYPGDIFSIHARLLERSTCLNAAHGGGSMTALPIVETHEGEIADYIPTNLISITDGQIYLERDLFTSGFRPAIDIGKSVSRIGGQAQPVSIKTESGRMKLDYLQFLELEMFTRFGAKLEPGMQNAIKRGRILRELLKQDRLSPVPVEFHMAWLVGFNDGCFNEVDLDSIPHLLSELQRYVADAGLNLEMERERWAREIQAFFLNKAGSA
ncbi:MAG: atpA, partial [Gammaproteobacteria bacterium]|nr:atpA [Gammaproteobacteria bacterium]